MVSARTAVYWRRGACDVPDWRRGNQSRDSGCGRDGKYPRRASRPPRAHYRRLAQSPGSERVANADDAAGAGVRAEPGDWPPARRPRASGVSITAETTEWLAAFAEDSRTVGRHGFSS